MGRKQPTYIIRGFNPVSKYHEHPLYTPCSMKFSFYIEDIEGCLGLNITLKGA